MTTQDRWKSQLTVTGRMADPTYIQDSLELIARDSWMPGTHMLSNGDLLPQGACVFSLPNLQDNDDGFLHLHRWFELLHPRKEALSLLKGQDLTIFLECWMETAYFINFELSPTRMAEVGSLFLALSDLSIDIDIRFEIDEG